jgi:hypothetical protein
MDNEEYLRIIENVRKQIKDDLLDGIDVKLEVMYNFKPVRLVWFIAKAELMLKQNIDLEEIYKSLEFKGLRLEKYNGIDDLCNIYIKMAKQRNDILDVNRNKWVQEKLNNNSSFNISKDLNNELEGNIKKCIEDFNSQKNITELALSYYQENNNVMYEIARAYSEKKGYTNTKVEFVQKITNMGYINSIIDCEEENVVVIIATNKNDYDDCTILMKILSNVGNKVYFIDLDYLIMKGLLKKEDVDFYQWQKKENLIDYAKLFRQRFRILHMAFEKSNHKEEEDYKTFCRRNEYWLKDYSLYMAIKTYFGNQEWSLWDDDIRIRTEEAVKKNSKQLENEIEFWNFCQFEFRKQWDKLKVYANSKNQ